MIPLEIPINLKDSKIFLWPSQDKRFRLNLLIPHVYPQRHCKNSGPGKPEPLFFRCFHRLKRAFFERFLKTTDGQAAVKNRLPALHPFQHGFERLYRMAEPVQPLFKKSCKQPVLEAVAVFGIGAQVQFFVFVHKSIIVPVDSCLWGDLASRGYA